MTEYGRPDSLPGWHPHDPLFGDRGDNGGRDGGYQGDPYAAQQSDPYATGGFQVPQQGYYEQQQQQPQQQQFYGHGGYDSGYNDTQGMAAVQDPYATGQQPNYCAAQQQYAQQPQVFLSSWHCSYVYQLTPSATYFVRKRGAFIPATRVGPGVRIAPHAR